MGRITKNDGPNRFNKSEKVSCEMKEKIDPDEGRRNSEAKR